MLLKRVAKTLASESDYVVMLHQALFSRCHPLAAHDHNTGTNPFGGEVKLHHFKEQLRANKRCWSL